MKGKLIGIYLMFALIAGTYSYFWGETRHRGYAYNLGSGLKWPVRIFSWTPEIDGDSEEEFLESFPAVLASAQKHGLYGAVSNSSNLLQFYLYARENASVTQSDYRAVLQGGPKAVDIILTASAAVTASPELNEEFIDYLDDLTAADIADELPDILEEINDLMESRPA